MQNKPNFSRADMNVTTYITKVYDNLRLYGRCENKPNFIRRSTSEGGLTQFWVQLVGCLYRQPENRPWRNGQYIRGDYFNNVTSSISDVNYVASMLEFSISGYITETDPVTAIADVNVSADNGGGYFAAKYGGGSGLTESSGYYEIVVDYNWTGTVRPSKYAYSFDPNNGREYINVLSDFTDQDYTGTLLTYSISGHIFDPNNRPLMGIVLDSNNGGGHDTTDVNGFYELWVEYDWSGTVTPQKQGYYFEPSQDVYLNVLNDYTDKDYMGVRNEDINVDGFIDGYDLWYIVEYWLQEDPPAGDLFEDNFMNFLDFARLANVWLIEKY